VYVKQQSPPATKTLSGNKVCGRKCREPVAGTLVRRNPFRTGIQERVVFLARWSGNSITVWHSIRRIRLQSLDQFLDDLCLRRAGRREASFQLFDLVHCHLRSLNVNYFTMNLPGFDAREFYLCSRPRGIVVIVSAM